MNSNPASRARCAASAKACTSASIAATSSACGSMLASSNASTDGATIGRQPPCATLNAPRSEEHTSELQSLMRISYAVFCLKKKKKTQQRKQQYDRQDQVS